MVVILDHCSTSTSLEFTDGNYPKVAAVTD